MSKLSNTKDKVKEDFISVMDRFYGRTQNYTIAEIKSLLLPFLPYLILLYETKLAPQEKVHEHGRETYGYDNDESIKRNLDYISDRWSCAFRVRWLINLLDIGYTFENDVKRKK